MKQEDSRINTARDSTHNNTLQTMNIPIDIWIVIFRYTDFGAKCALRTMCKRFRAAMYHTELPDVVERRLNETSVLMFPKLQVIKYQNGSNHKLSWLELKHFPELTTLYVNQYMKFEPIVLHFLPKLQILDIDKEVYLSGNWLHLTPNLKILRIREGRVEGEALGNLKQLIEFEGCVAKDITNTTLESLTIWGKRSKMHCVSKLTNLKYLSIRDCHRFKASLYYLSNLTCLKLFGYFDEPLVINNPLPVSLIDLELNWIDYTAGRLELPRLKKLEMTCTRVDLSQCTVLEDLSLYSNEIMAENIPCGLIRLSLYGVPNISLDDLKKFTKLQTLCLHEMYSNFSNGVSIYGDVDDAETFIGAIIEAVPWIQKIKTDRNIAPYNSVEFSKK